MECIQCGKEDGREDEDHVSICIACEEKSGSCEYCGSIDCDREACKHAAMEEFEAEIEEKIERRAQRRN